MNHDEFEIDEITINDIMEGVAFLIYCGDFYEYIGHNKNNLLLFQDIHDDTHIEVSYNDLLHSDLYSIAY